MNWDLLNIPTALAALPQWVCAKAGSKTPMQARRRQPASSTDPATWTSFGEATRAVEAGRYDNVGFVFNHNGIVGIDIDQGYGPEGELSELAAEIIGLCGSYTERSRSGRGFHVLLYGELPFAGKNNLAGVEIYQAARYFIMTGDVVDGHKRLIRNQEAVHTILARHFPQKAREGGNGPGEGSCERIYSPVWPERTQGRIPLRPGYPAIFPGGRNISLTSLAGQLHSAGYGRDRLREELERVNREACRPPLPGSEIETIVRSVSKYRR